MDKRERLDYLLQAIDDANLDIFEGHSIKNLHDENFKAFTKLVVDRLKLADQVTKILDK
ncbi:hypothetical protein [Lactobacillus taiwanensis]|nr:hypothetical protein [Lactobacillus taiwanensis]